MTSTDYTETHDNTTKILQMEFSFKNGILDKEKSVPYYLYIENEEIILYWDKTRYYPGGEEKGESINYPHCGPKLRSTIIVKKKNIANYALNLLGYGVSKIYQ